MKTPTLKSSCCNADLAVHLDSEGTCCYICNNCGSDCDVASEKTPTLSKEAELLITRYEPELVQDFGNESLEMVKSKSGAWVSFDDAEKLVKAREQSAILAERKRIDFELRSKEKKHSNRKRYFTDDELYRAVYPEALTQAASDTNVTHKPANEYDARIRRDERKKIGNGWKELVGKLLLWRDENGGGINLADVADFSKFETLLEDKPPQGTPGRQFIENAEKFVEGTGAYENR